MGEQTYPTQDGMDIDANYGQPFSLIRHIRAANNNDTDGVEEGEKDFFTKVSEFYSDKNNLAMYLVLPLIVVVYGGCSTIYCVAKCRQYLRKRKHKQMSDTEQLNEAGSQMNINENNEQNPLNDEQINDNFDKTNKNDCKRSIASAADVNCGVGGKCSTPLPWQVPDENCYQEEENISRQSIDDVIIPPRPQSNIHRDQCTGSESSRPETASSVKSNWLEIPARNAELVNSNIDKSTNIIHKDPDVIPVSDKRLASKEDDQVSLDLQNNTGKFSRASSHRVVEDIPNNRRKNSVDEIIPLETNSDKHNSKQKEEHMGSVSLAKQAAQLLRVELQNRRGVSKKQKRLVFVAE